MKKQYEERSYQIECWQALAQARRDGLSKGLIVVASSLGKTFISIRDVEQFWQEYGYGRVLFMCHSNPILDQAKENFQEYYGEQCSYGFYTGLAKSSIPTTFLFATFRSLSGHLEAFEKDEFDYIIVDEAHHSPADTYQPVIEYFQPKFLLGMTATPDRLDCRNVEEIFGSPIFELPMAKALVDSWIAEIEYHLILDEMEEIGFYLEENQKITKEELNRKVFMPKRDEEIIRLIKQYANEWCENPQTIIYCKNIVHAKKIAELYEGAEAITSDFEPEKNRESISRFKSGELRTIVSIEMLNEGVDIPSVDVIVFLRNTAAPRIFWQQLNRGTRKTATKTKVRVLDFVANVERMELVFATQKEIEDALKNQQPGGENKGKALSASDLFSIDTPTPQFKEKLYDIERLIRDIGLKTVTFYTKEELILILQTLAKKLNRSPYCTDVGKDGLPDFRTFKKALGNTWNKVLQTAGLEIHDLGDYSPERLLQDIKDLAAELGRTPTKRDVATRKDMASPQIYTKAFGSWNKSLKAAGFTPNLQKDGFVDEEMIQYLSDYITQLGHIPTSREYAADMNTKFNLHTYLNHFDNWNKAIKLARPGLRCYKHHTTKDELSAELCAFAIELGRLPLRKEVENNKNLASIETYSRHFGRGRKNILQKTGVVNTISKIHISN